MTNLSRHPVLRAIYGASQAIEKCGASRELTDAVMAVTALYAPAEGLLDRIASLERQLEDAKAQLAERTRERDEARYILAGSDYGSLPNDWTLPRVAEARMGDINKLTWQVRDTCARAESAERALAEARKDGDRLDWIAATLSISEWNRLGFRGFAAASIRAAIDSAIEAEKGAIDVRN